jgi:tetratricopeptide (TPR) repeat protein
VEVDPRLIRRARLDSGLSMAQLAGSEVTRQAIFLIEAGKTRPSMRTLELIASRTGKPAGYFMRPAEGSPGGPISNGYQVEELEALCLQQQFEEAIALGNRVLEHRVPARVEAYVRQYIGQAFVRSSRPDDALEQLRRANEILEAQPDPWLAVECADWEACALYLKEDKRALAVAEHALKLCRATQPRLPGTEARILEHIASIHVKNHNFDRAITYYEEALEAAGSVRDLARLGRTYHGLSIAYQERGDLGRAVEFTHKALALYGLEHDTALLGRGENELGLLLMRQGKMARAEEAFHAAMDHFDESGTERAKSHVLLSLAELQLKTGRLKEASDTVKQALELAVRLNESIALGDAHQLLGQIYEQMGKRRLADKEFGAAIRLLHGEGLEQRLAESHAAFAEVLESRGQSTLARKHWKNAANLALQREAAGARTLKAL